MLGFTRASSSSSGLTCLFDDHVPVGLVSLSSTATDAWILTLLVQYCLIPQSYRAAQTPQELKVKKTPVELQSYSVKIMMILHACSPLFVHSFPAIHNRNVVGKMMIKCDRKQSMSTKVVMSRHLFSGLAASLIFLSPINPVLAADIPYHLSVCQIENATANKLTLPLDESSSEGNETLAMMEGMVDNKLTLPLDESSSEEIQRLIKMRGMMDNKFTLVLNESSGEGGERLVMADNKLTLPANEILAEGSERLMMADSKFALPLDESSGEGRERLMMTDNKFTLPLDESSGEGSERFMMVGMADNKLTLPLDESSGEGSEKLMMMRGMTARNFDPVRYSGRWFEVASLKRGFAGQGQEDCHCTQGVYTFNMEQPSIQVDTFCVHGGPDGYITGIRGKVQCVSEEELKKTETDLEKVEMIREKCYLRFPTLPFIPKEPYDVIATDYDNFAVVSGAKDKSFVQIYSRTPTPGPEFIEKYKDYLADFGYDPSQIKDTPQDCEVMSDSRLAAMMSMSGMQQALTNQFPDLELKKAVQFNPLTSVFDTVKKLVELYFK